MKTPVSTTVTVTVPNHLMPRLVGPLNENLRLVEDAFEGTSIHARGNEFTIDGTDAALAARLVDELRLLLEQGHAVDPQVVHRTIDMVRADERPSEVLTAEVLRSARGRSVRPKTSGQKRYADAISESTVTFGVGPAGTGKSYLAVALAVQALQEKKVDRIILTRPAVEAGERLGFLPGDLMAKIDPYLRPLYDALYDMMGTEAARRLLEAGTVEVAPLAYMRGRAQPVDTPVLTPEGFRPIGDLAVGDLVVGSDGHPTPVLGVYPQGRKPVWRVSSQDGAGTLACGDHLWFVRTRRDRRRGRPGRVVRTADMVGRERSRGRRTFELPLVGPVQFEPRGVPIDPYAVGLLLGGGRPTPSATPACRSADPELAAALEAAIPDAGPAMEPNGTGHALRQIHAGGGSRAAGTIAESPTTAAIRTLGIGGTPATRFLPPEYLLNSSEVRLALLQGLLDSDGVPARQKHGSCGVRFSTPSARLRDDIVFLVRSLGGVAHTRPRQDDVVFLVRSLGGVAHTRPRQDDAHVIDIRLPETVAPFRLSGKKAIYDAAGGDGRPDRFVEQVEPAGEAECVCIAVGAQDSLYVTEDFIVTHNTLNNSFIILDEAQNTTPEQMKMFLTRIGFGSKVVVTGDDTQVDLPGGRSGLVGLEAVLSGIDGLSWVRLGRRDVVRHRIVADIVNAYEAADAIQGQ